MNLRQHTAARPSGTMIVTTEHGDTIERDTLTCCHCGRVWVVQPGSGRVRGFCHCCNAPTCGHPDCDNCLPYEKRLELEEAGKLVQPVVTDPKVIEALRDHVNFATGKKLVIP